MKYALDTNIVSYIFKGNENIAARIDREVLSGNEVTIPPIAYYELKRGLIAINASTKLRKLKEFCSKNEVGEIDREILDAAADIHAAMRSIGQLTEDADILLAAFCIVRGYILVTHNQKHFNSIKGLKTEDWAI